MTYKIPKEVLEVLERLEEIGSEAYLVGGCVRDLLREVEPKDWDITTNADPEKIQGAFENTFYENEFGTVGVVIDSEDPALKVIEVTPYRFETKYSDKRHPDIVKFSGKLEDDLKRRDFTVNAMAMRVSQMAFVYQEGGNSPKETGEMDEKYMEVVDLWKGREDLQKKIIRTVGEPKDRFDEDALRILRAVRLATEMDFEISKETEKAIEEEAHLVKIVSKERIRDELVKIIISKSPRKGFYMLRDVGILQYILPELEEGIEVTQNKEHVFNVWEHNLRSLGHAAEKGYPLDIRMAALLHDIGKPRTKKGEGVDSTFYNHELVGAKIAAKILSRLRFPKKFTEKVILLVRWHLFFSDTDIITLSAVRRMIRNVGPENIWDLMKVRFCDRVGMGRPKEEPYRLRKYESMVEEALRDPVSVGQLEIDGDQIMKITGEKPGQKIGFILHALLEEVLEDPSLNKKDYLIKRVKELVKLPDEEIEKLGMSGKEKKEKIEQEEVGEIKKKYGVK